MLSALIAIAFLAIGFVILGAGLYYLFTPDHWAAGIILVIVGIILCIIGFIAVVFFEMMNS